MGRAGPRPCRCAHQVPSPLRVRSSPFTAESYRRRNTGSCAASSRRSCGTWRSIRTGLCAVARHRAKSSCRNTSRAELFQTHHRSVATSKRRSRRSGRWGRRGSVMSMNGGWRKALMVSNVPLIHSRLVRRGRGQRRTSDPRQHPGSTFDGVRPHVYAPQSSRVRAGHRGRGRPVRRVRGLRSGARRRHARRQAAGHRVRERQSLQEWRRQGLPRNRVRAGHPGPRRARRRHRRRDAERARSRRHERRLRRPAERQWRRPARCLLHARSEAARRRGGLSRRRPHTGRGRAGRDGPDRPSPDRRT